MSQRQGSTVRFIQLLALNTTVCLYVFIMVSRFADWGEGLAVLMRAGRFVGGGGDGGGENSPLSSATLHYPPQLFSPLADKIAKMGWGGTANRPVPPTITVVPYSKARKRELASRATRHVRLYLL